MQPPPVGASRAGSDCPQERRTEGPPKAGRADQSIARSTPPDEAAPLPRGGPEHLGLTTAELRLLRPTQLPFREIGERLRVSQHGEDPRLSVYRKLGIASRSQAVQRLQQLGLGPQASPESSLYRRVGMTMSCTGPMAMSLPLV
jgi:hypothetical protein